MPSSSQARATGIYVKAWGRNDSTVSTPLIRVLALAPSRHVYSALIRLVAAIRSIVPTSSPVLDNERGHENLQFPHIQAQGGQPYKGESSMPWNYLSNFSFLLSHRPLAAI